MHLCPHCGISLKKFTEFNYGNASYDDCRNLRLNGREVRLPITSAIIIEALIRAEGRTLSRQTLLSVLDCDGTDRAIDVYMSRARKALREIDPRFDQIECNRSLGYRWRRENEMMVAA